MPSEPLLQLAFLTGQSDPGRCALSPQQRAFGHALLARGRRLQPHNFPYCADTPPHEPTPLWRAAWHNGTQHLGSHRCGFASRHRAPVLRMLQAAPHTVLLAGSCGLQLLTNLSLDHEALQRVSVLAYGPVARRAPACARLLTVAGKSDWITRLGYGHAMLQIRCGHMDYLAQPEMLALARRFIAEVEAGLE
jgi:hypothetical protein